MYIYIYVPVEKWDEVPGDNLFERIYVLQKCYSFTCSCQICSIENWIERMGN
jgi:hypothetical protein